MFRSCEDSKPKTKRASKSNSSKRDSNDDIDQTSTRADSTVLPSLQPNHVLPKASVSAEDEQTASLTNSNRARPNRKSSDASALEASTGEKDSASGKETIETSQTKRGSEERVTHKISGIKITASPAATTAGSPTSPAVDDDTDWVFRPPPINQRTFYFPEDDLEFSSEFDSGNLIQVERVGTLKYNFYNCMDCGNSEMQTNNRQWFHFSVRGGGKGISITITFVGVMHSHMFKYDWMPVMAIFPEKSEYVRIPGRATVVSLENMPPTPGCPFLEYKLRGGDDSDAEQAGDDALAASGAPDEDTSNSSPAQAQNTVITFSAPTKSDRKKNKAKRKKDIAMNVTFEFRMDAAIPKESEYPLGHPACPAMYIASNHPYSYSTLRQNLLNWQITCLKQNGEEKSVPELLEHSENPYKYNMKPSASRDASTIYFHREVLCLSLEGRPVELLTISDCKGINLEKRAPMISAQYGIPYSSSSKRKEEKYAARRPYAFDTNVKSYVVLTARVHPGECPGSHMMHGSISFLLNKKDPRAQALRERFVFLIVPMINPDGVVRGHSRVDANGVDLNRMYTSPSQKQQPVPFCLRWLLIPLATRKQLSLFVDMHAHANKKGAFLYGNALPAQDQIQSLLYARLVSLNTPYLDFNSCNYSDVNMFSVGRSGKSKDSSARIVLFLETGFVFSYAIETSHVCASSLPTLPRLPGIHDDSVSDLMSVRFTPQTFGDIGRGVLLGLLDLHRANPVSRVPLTPFSSVDGVETFLERQLKIEASEKLFSLAYKDGCASQIDITSNQSPLQQLMLAWPPESFPDKINIKGARNLPFLSFTNLKHFLPMPVAISILEQTPALKPPRSLYSGSRSRGTSPATGIVQPFPEYTASESPWVAKKEKKKRSTSRAK